MPAFKDSRNREWLVTLDGPKIREVRKELNVDLIAPDGSGFLKLQDDVLLLVDTIWILVREQAQRLNVTDADFGAALAGDPIDAATECLLNAINDFFPQRKRSLLRSLAEKNAAMRKQAEELAIAKIEDPELARQVKEAMQATMDREILKALQQISATSATNTPESSA